MKLDGKEILSDESMEAIKKTQTEMSKIFDQQAKVMAKVAIPSEVLKMIDNLAPVFESVQNIMEPITKQLSKIAKAVEEVQEEFAALYPQRAETIKNMSSIGWTVGNIDSFQIMDSLDGMSTEEMDEFLINYYSKDNYKNMFEELDLIIEFLDAGYKNQAKTLKSILTQDINNYKIAIPVLFPILEYTFEKEMGMLNMQDTMRFRDIRDKKQLVNKKDLKSIWISMIVSTYTVLQNDFDNGSSQRAGFNQGINKVKYSRHSVLHGRFNPSRLTIKDLIQLILLTSSVQSIAPIEEHYK